MSCKWILNLEKLQCTRLFLTKPKYLLFCICICFVFCLFGKRWRHYIAASPKSNHDQEQTSGEQRPNVGHYALFSSIKIVDLQKDCMTNLH